jgi:hypothetical protein
MEKTQGISLYSYHYVELAKMPCFSYYLEAGVEGHWGRGEMRK